MVLCRAAAGEVSVRLTSPSAGVVALGEVEVAAEPLAEGEELARLEFYVDALRVGSLTEPPWRLTVEIGGVGREHRIGVVAYGTEGGEARDSVLLPPFRIHDTVDLELQQLYVTVTRAGRRVPGLERGDFTVLDRDQRQRIVTFAFGDIPFSALLLVDASVSMERNDMAAAARRAAEGFAAGMTPLDEARAMVFSDHLVAASPFTSDPESLAATLAPQELGGTALNDHLYWAVRLLERRNGRRVVILLSDGRDIHSVLDMEQTRAAVRRSQAMIFWVRLTTHGQGGPISTNYRDRDQGRRQLELLRKTVRESGGRTLTSRDGSAIEAALAEILDELREQYVVGYYPDPRLDDGRWRSVAVQLRGSGMKVRTAAGYVDFDRSDE